MPDATKIPPQIIDAINTNQKATMLAGVVRTAGAGKAYQSVAQSSAIAVQDAADNLRNMGTLTSTAIGAAFTQILNNPSQANNYEDVIKFAQDAMTRSIEQFKKVGNDAAQVLRQFPSG